LFDSNVPGAGKGLLAHLISTILVGRRMACTAYSDSDEEMRKRITAIALVGDLLMLIDNIASRFGGSAIDAVITATTWKDRLLGHSEMTAELPLFTCWYATGNNIELRGDAIRRVLPCRIDSEHERPEERSDFTHPELLKDALQDRGKLVAAALTILRGYVVAGRPAVGTTPLGSFEEWSKTVRNALIWAGEPDPCITRKGLEATDSDGADRLALVNGWLELPGQSSGLTVAEAARYLNDPNKQDEFTTLRDALLEMSRTDGLPSAQVIGKRLRSIRDRIIGGKRFRSTLYEGTQRWRVEEVKTS
jgi:hypothetical protein